MLARSGNLPLHVQIAEIFKARIVDGTWPDGVMIPPEKTLCEEFNVARGTLRQALRSLEAEGVLRRERGRGTFVQMDRSRQSNSKIGTGHLAFIVPYVRDSSVSTILVGFQRVAEQNRFSVIFHHVSNDLQQQEEVVRRLIRDQIDGIGLYPVDSDHRLPLDQLAMRGIPLILIDRYIKGSTTDFVMSDHFDGALQATSFLLDKGHDKVGFVTWRSPAVSMEHRLAGYQQALRERGIAPSDRYFCIVTGYPAFDLAPLIEFLKGADRPTAVFAANDQIASAVYRAAAAVGLAIPADLSVVGFDNLDFSAHLDPPLTTMAQPFSEIGATAASILIRRLRGEQFVYQKITLSTSLVERLSVAAPP